MSALYAKLFAIQKSGVSVPKNGNNPHFKSKYMTLDDIVDTLKPLVDSQELLVTHFIQDHSLVTRVCDIGTGDAIESAFPLIATDPQKKWSEVTYGKRYNLASIFNICADEDDDANSVSPQVTKEPEKPWITKANIDALIKALQEWVVTAWSGDEAVALARSKYAVSKASAEDIKARFLKEVI